ncbi:crotonobetainyl-CoA:carnitine CoA-transferase CaiB-like acyl-CoA transferase [Antricoccus suffuscus]|uniref:Crotonobetainyl-CoA:carnitine CoA-transferase CaiB-like acyl-CoA transferase n=1 Tax=Antricoccus suffuscus TaxID=1629062 RepID=A0A2T1A6M6_9ACTN|nr:CoA transferase [Antricoccus suffuscus]PRZ44246.1 crotonobetainyl-CoA:carnitine CoA-transferase CaiB-like acyl-CoA transferase [Antricoccus suffuscus]
MSGSVAKRAPRKADVRPPALRHLHVVDLSAGVAGQYCCRVLASAGARVTLVEPPEGTATRRMPPYDASGDSTLFRHLNQGKHGVVVPNSADGDARLADLVASADVIVRDLPGGEISSAVPIPESAIDCVISDFPEDGPYATWKADEMVHQALSGYMNATGRGDRRPLFGVGHRAYYACGTTATTSILAALHERRRSGQGQRVRATVFESIAAIGQNFVTQYTYNGTSESRARYTGLLATLRCSDGYIVMFAMRDSAAVCRTFDAEHLITDPRFDRPASLIRNWDELVQVFQAKAQTMTTAEVVRRAQAERISCERVATLGELLDSEQWRERDVVRAVGPADGGPTEFALGPLYRVSGSPGGVTTSSPRLAPASRRVAGR